MRKITLTRYDNLPADFRGVWTTERTDWPNWEQVREKYMGKRTMPDSEDGATVLLIEGLHFEVVADDYYTREFTSGKSSISRGELESLPCPFCTDDVTDQVMQDIIDNVEIARLITLYNTDRSNFSNKECYLESLSEQWWEDLEDFIVEAGIPYYEDL